MTMILSVKPGNCLFHCARIIKNLQIIAVVDWNRIDAALIHEVANPANCFIRGRNPHLIFQSNYFVTSQSLEMLPIFIFHDLIGRQYLLVIINRQNDFGPFENIEQLIVAMTVIALILLGPQQMCLIDKGHVCLMTVSSSPIPSFLTICW